MTMNVNTVKRVLAGRIASREQDYGSIGPVVLEVRVLDPLLVQRIKDSHALMANYSLELSQHPLELDEVTKEFLEEYIQLFQRELPATEDSQWDAYFAVMAIRAVCFSDSGEAVVQLRQLLEQVDFIPPVEEMDAQSNEFWEVLENLCMALELERAAELVTKAANAHPFFQDLASLLLDFPDNAPREAFWAWRREVLAAAQVSQGLPLPWGPAISRVLAILSGRKDDSQHWLRAAVSQFAYLDPDASQWPQHLKSPAAQQVLEGNAPDWEVSVARVMDQRAHSGILNLQALDTCSAVILAEFLYRTNKLHSPFASTPSLREYLGICHALECLECPQLVQLGLDLLLSIDTPYSRALLAQSLPQLGLEAPESRKYALDLCAKFGFADTAAALHNKIAEYELHRNVLQSLSHFYLAGNLSGMVDATWEVFEQMLISSNPLEMPESPKNIEKTVADCAAPLAILSNIILGNSVDSSIRQLLSSDLLPSKYTPLLVAYASGVAEQDSTVIALMQALSQWEVSDEGLALLRASRNAPWAAGIDQEFEESEIILMLHRELAQLVFSV